MSRDVRSVLNLPAASVPDASLASVPVGTMKGRQIDAGSTGVPVNLTGAEQAENWRRSTVQLVDGGGAGASGTLDIALNDDATVLLIRSSADVTLRTLGSTAPNSEGREVVIEHDRLSGTGTLTIKHNTAGTYATFYNPELRDVVLGQTTCLEVRGRSGFWRPQGSVGELQRFPNVQVPSLAPGVQTLTLLATTDTVFVQLSSTGDAIIDQIVYGAGGAANAGARIRFFRDSTAGSAGRLIFRDGNASFNSIWTPASQDFIVPQVNDGVELWSNGFRWYLATRVITSHTLAQVIDNEAVPFTKRIAFSATGTTGTNIDVTVWNAAAPFGLRLIAATLRISTAAGGSAALRTASGGGGSVVLPDASNTAVTFSFEAAGRYSDNAGATATVAASGSLFLRIDRAAAGELVLEAVRT